MKFKESGLNFQDILKQKPLKNEPMPKTYKGLENQIFKPGDKVIMSGFGPIKPMGKIYTIKEVYNQNGYFYYILVEKTGHYSFRTKELQKP